MVCGAYRHLELHSMLCCADLTCRLLRYSSPLIDNDKASHKDEGRILQRTAMNVKKIWTISGSKSLPAKQCLPVPRQNRLHFNATQLRTRAEAPDMNFHYPPNPKWTAAARCNPALCTFAKPDFQEPVDTLKDAQALRGASLIS